MPLKCALAWLVSAATLAAQTPYYPFRLTNVQEDPLNYGAARFARLANAGSLVVDRAGNLYVADWGMIRKVTPDGVIAPLKLPPPNEFGGGYRFLTIDSEDNLYFYDSRNFSVWRLTASGELRVWVPPPMATNVIALAAGNNGELYVLERGRLSKVLSDSGHTVVHLAGTGAVGYSGDGGPARDAMIYAQGVAVDSGGTVYLADSGNDRVRAIDSSGTIRTVAGVNRATAIVPTGRGTLYVSGVFPPAIYEVNEAAHTVRLVSGTLEGGLVFLPQSWGDGGPAAEARIRGPWSMALGRDGSLYFMDEAGGVRIRRIGPDGIVTTFAGCGCGQEPVPVQWLTVNQSFGVTRGPDGSLYFSDRTTHQVRRVGTDGIATVVAGRGDSGFTGDGGPATEARLSYPAGVALDAAGNLYIADQQNHRVRRVSVSGVITTAAGDGGGEDINSPDGVAVDAAGTLYVSDTGGHRVRRVAADGGLVTVAGSGAAGSAGDGGPATAAQLENPRGLAIDTDGGLLISDSSAHRVRKVGRDGTIRTVAALDPFGTPYQAIPDNKGGLIVADNGSYRVVSVDASGQVRALIPPNATTGISPPTGVALGPDGTIYIASLGLMAWRPVDAEPVPPVPTIRSAGITNAAGQSAGVVAAGEIVSIYGTQLGPKIGTAASPSGGRLGTVLAGVRVWFDEIPGAVMYASDTQINAVAPFGLAGREQVAVRTELNGVFSNEEKIPVLAAAPSLFRIATNAAALNQDGSVNSLERPARRGEVVALFGTGGGAMTPTPVDGEITGASLFRLAAPVRAMVGGAEAVVEYAGSAPGFVAGALQVNVRIPAEARSGDVTVVIGDQALGASIILR